MKKGLFAILFSVLFFVFNIVSAYGEHIWTTVRNSAVRVVPMNSVRAEAMAIWNRFQFVYFDWDSTNSYRSRSHYLGQRAFTELFSSGWSPSARRAFDRETNWLNNNRRLVYAGEAAGLGVNLTFVIDDEVLTFTFANMNPIGIGYSTRNRNHRLWFEELIDELLADIMR